MRPRMNLCSWMRSGLVGAVLVSTAACSLVAEEEWDYKAAMRKDLREQRKLICPAGFHNQEKCNLARTECHELCVRADAVKR